MAPLASAVEAVRGAGASSEANYLVISERLRERIRSDENANTLPSETDLMREHDVSRNTIRRARDQCHTTPKGGTQLD